MTTAAGQEKRQRISMFRRILWHVNRTGLAWGVKAGVTALNLHEKRERRRLARGLIIAPDIQAKAADLNRNGYVTINELVDQVMLERLSQAGLDKVARADQLQATQATAHKNFWIRLLDEDIRDGAFDSDNLFVRHALQPGVIELLASVLGELPLLVDVLLTLSRDTDSAHSYSQLWHRDYDDVRTLKLFTYLTDVRGLDDGPFTFVPRPASNHVGFTLHSHVNDEEVFRHVDRSDVQAVIGPRLTTFVVETSRCFHMGSRMAPGHSRLMYTATFISAPSVYPASGGPRFRAVGPLDTASRLLLGL